MSTIKHVTLYSTGAIQAYGHEENLLHELSNSHGMNETRIGHVRRIVQASDEKTKFIAKNCDAGAGPIGETKDLTLAEFEERAANAGLHARYYAPTGVPATDLERNLPLRGFTRAKSPAISGPMAWFSDPGLWKEKPGPSADDRRAEISCPECCQVIDLEHYTISPSGSIQPSVSCHATGCNWTGFVDLVGWDS